MAIVNRIDEVLKDIGKTRYWLAKQAGIDYDKLVSICKNEKKMLYCSSVEKICRVLKCNIGDLWKCI